ncbi:MAG: fused MFS/spermidine synthase [Candidatus Delongbacteria bacterium]
MTNKLMNQKKILMPAVFAAGLSFLIYEVVWDRLLSLYLGITVHASTIVISSYMAGLAAGSFFFGKKAQRSNDPVIFLSILLFIIPVVNLSVFRLLLFLPDIYSSEAWGMNIDIFTYAYSMFLVFASAFFIGGFMPAVSRIFVMTGNSTGQAIGNTFGIETFGSATGGILAGFVLLGSLGSSGSVYFAVSVNLLTALIIWKTLKLTGQRSEKAPEKKSKKIRKLLLEKPKTAMIAVFISGLCGFIFQITAMRIFRIYLTNTTYTFSLIVSVTISGYFIGSMIFKKMSKKEFNTEKILLYSMFLMGLVIAVSILVFINAPKIIIIPLHAALKASWARILIPPAAMSLLTVLPQSIVSGLVFTSAVKLYKNQKDKISSGFGKIYFVNTAGAFLGPFAAAFFLIPYAGVVRTLFLISLILSAVSLLFYCLRRQKRTVMIIAGSILPIILIFNIFGKTKMILPPSFSLFDREILFYKETVEATLVVGRERGSDTKYTYFNNNSVIGSSYDAIKAVKLLGHLPFLTNDAPEKVLIVGFGIGVTTATVLLHDEVEKVECVELAKDLIEAAKYYTAFNNNVTDDPRLTIIGDDGRHYLQKSDKKYDLISSDPTHPVLGSGALYSYEYFRLCHDHLSDDGIVTQYLPLHKLKKNDFAGIIATFKSVFENTTVWMGHTHAILYGSKKPLRIDFADFKEKALRINDQYVYNNPYSLASYLALADVSGIVEGAEICYDNKSYLDFFSFDSFDPENWAVNAENIRKHYNTGGIFYNIDDPETFNRFKQSSRLLLEALTRSMSGDMQGYMNKLYEALNINPENQEISFLIKLENLKSGN